MLIEEVYERCKRRLIIVDQEGSLPFKGKREPNNEGISALNELSQDPKNLVIIVSIESKKALHEQYAKRAPKVALAAENGFFWRWNSENKTDEDWNKLIEIQDFMWIKQVRLIMEMYKEKTDGSFIIEKETNIIWNYK